MYYTLGILFIGLVQRQRARRNDNGTAVAAEEKESSASFPTEKRFGISNNGRFSESVSYGGVVYTSGQVGKGRTIHEATASALEDVDHALALASSDKSKLLSVTIYLRNINRDYSGMNEVYDQWIHPGKPPCRATVEAKLADPEWLIEVHAIARQ